MNAALMKLMCILPLAMCSEPVGWAFVQSVGGISIGNVSVSKGNYSLAVNADVSGLEQVTVKPTLVNSALICESTTATIQDKAIYLTINKGVIREGYSTHCPAAKLKHIKAGNYQVFYKSPNGDTQPLGEILIDADSKY
jgi:hypothetical protein